MLVGIIPLAGYGCNLGMPWPDYLHPIASGGYTGLKRSIYDCALAGCKSIWVVCNDDEAPLVKKLIGDYVLDPDIYEKWNFVSKKEDYKHYIPVYYTPINSRDRGRRDSLGWSVLHGALAAFNVSSRISNWVVPNKYFVSFPLSIYDPDIVREHRGLINSCENFYFSYRGLTVREGHPLPFTFCGDSWILFKSKAKELCTGGSRNLPLSERWSSRDFTLDKIFYHDKIVVEDKVELQSYHNINTWEGILEYYRSFDRILDLPKSFIKPYFNKQKKKELTWNKE